MNNRLFPKKSSGRYYILTELRKIIQKIINSNESFGKVLDYGAKNSPYKSLFDHKCETYVTSDIDPFSNCDVILDLKGKIPLGNNQFDTVLSSQVLEHVKDVGFYLKEVNRILKPQGKLILSTHGIWKFHPDPSDFWRWTGQGLDTILSDNGFEVVNRFGVVGLASTGIQLFQDGVIDKIPAPFRGLFCRLIVFVQTLFDDNVDTNNDASIFVIEAKKKNGRL